VTSNEQKINSRFWLLLPAARHFALISAIGMASEGLGRGFEKRRQFNEKAVDNPYFINLVWDGAGEGK
jgi:hypothetical protein